MSKMESDDLIIVAEDLRYLENDFGPDINDDEIRRGSAILRRLLVENVYGRAWRSVGFEKEPRLLAVDLLSLIGPIPHNDVVIALAGGAEYRGIQIAGFCLSKKSSSSGPVKDQTPPSNKLPGEREYGMSEFLGSAAGIAAGIFVTRREVIKYIANIKGGVHLDSKQRKAEEKLVARVSKIEKKFRIYRTDALLVELLAIGQALGRSDDTQRFLEKVLGRRNPSVL
jgi:hypothetical protein